MKRTLKLPALLFAALFTATACSSQQAVTAAAEPEVVSVAAVAASRGTLEHRTAYSGRVAPAESVYIIGKVSGTVSATYFEVGDEVKAGDLLYEIDPVDVMLSVNQALAAYNTAAAQTAMQLGSTYDAQILQSESARTQARLGYKSAEEAVDKLEKSITALDKQINSTEAASAAVLFGSAASSTDISEEGEKLLKSLSLDADDYIKDGVFNAEKAKAAVLNALKKNRETLETSLKSAETAQKQADTGYDAARRATALTTGDAYAEAEAVANASLAQARAALDVAMAQVGYCKVTTPISGTVELKSVSVNGMSAPSTPAYVISNKETMQVTFGVPADTARKFEIGDAVTVENGKIAHSAVIVEIAEMVDQASGLFPVKVNITDECGDLLTGIAVKLTATTDRAENALLIPTGAIYYDDGAAYVYVARDGAAVKTFVETGIFADGKTEITDGLSAGDLVVTTWDSHLRDGALVSVKEG